MISLYVVCETVTCWAFTPLLCDAYDKPFVPESLPSNRVRKAFLGCLA